MLGVVVDVEPRLSISVALAVVVVLVVRSIKWSVESRLADVDELLKVETELVAEDIQRVVVKGTFDG